MPMPKGPALKHHAATSVSIATKAEAPPRPAIADVTNTQVWVASHQVVQHDPQGQEMLLAEGGKRIKLLELKPPPPL